MNNRNVYSQRMRFEKEVLSALRPLLKGTPWKKSQNALFTQSGDYYQEVQVCLDFAKARTTAKWSIKPMAVDSILWAIVGCGECSKQPLSFRSFGVNTCQALPIFGAEVESEGDSPEHVAGAVAELCRSRIADFRELTDGKPYSSLFANFRMRPETPWFGPEVVIALISEGEFSRAREAALDYGVRGRASDPLSALGGRSIFEDIVEWLDAGGPARLGIVPK